MIIAPIKIQGKKTKLVPYILENIRLSHDTIWIEPFLGSGEVLFNVNPNKAVVSDNNKLIIACNIADNLVSLNKPSLFITTVNGLSVIS